MAHADGMNGTEREAYWREQIAACCASGMPAVRWCREAGIAVAKYYWWRGELRRRDAAAGVPALFAEIRAVPHGGAWSPPPVEIGLTAGRVVRVHAGFDGDTLARVVRVLEGL